MFFSAKSIASALLLLLARLTAASAEVETITINGTQLKMTTDSGRDVVTFSNACGTQTMPRRELLRGAIPAELIPCPRASVSTEAPAPYIPAPAPPPVPRVRWGAIAAGIDDGFSGSRVAVGSSLRNDSESEARSRALSNCRSGGVSSCRVVGTFTGCGYITLSTQGSSPVAWGSGPTGQAAYNNCYARIDSGNCDLPAIGGCN